jgi:hypothetical protein
MASPNKFKVIVKKSNYNQIMIDFPRDVSRFISIFLSESNINTSNMSDVESVVKYLELSIALSGDIILW